VPNDRSMNMTTFDDSPFAALTWLEPWQPMAAPARSAAEAALRRELGAGHALFGRPAHAIAKRSDSDDVLFALEAPGELAVVHLTRARNRAPDSPHAMLFASVAEFVEGCMQPDHAEYTEADDLE
jgi:hypothetical protein